MIRPGSIADYDRLAPFHYRSGRPATIAQVLVDGDRGVLVVSMPARFGPWREHAWPDPKGARLNLAQVNSTVRVISRVIVDPRWRGLGVGTGLVRAYLSAPLTPRTEAIAIMGRFCPLFESAGMRRVEWRPSRRVVRLRAELQQLQIDPWRLADPHSLLASLGPAQTHRIETALRSFARAHGDSRARAGAPLIELATLAARHISCKPAVFVHEHQPPNQTRLREPGGTP